jgi:hypothetical protein
MIPSAFPSPVYLTSSTWAGPNEERHAGPTLMQAHDNLAGTGILTPGPDPGQCGLHGARRQLHLPRARGPPRDGQGR